MKVMIVDMSVRAITRRLRRASELRDLCRSLGKAVRKTGKWCKKADPDNTEKTIKPKAERH
jgi:hypothetical protein